MIKVHIHQFKEDKEPTSVFFLPAIPKQGDVFESVEEAGKFYRAKQVWYRLLQESDQSVAEVHLELEPF